MAWDPGPLRAVFIPLRWQKGRPHRLLADGGRARARKGGVNVGGRTQTQDRHTQIHTHSGLNAYLLANLKDRFLKKQTNKKDK